MSTSYHKRAALDFISPNAYLDISQYFSDYFDLRKEKQPSFSYDIWSAELGFKSRSYLKMVCTGHRGVTNKLIEIFSKKNHLNSIQESHLVSIFLYQKATTAVEKKLHLDKIFETLEPSPKNPEVQDYIRFLSHIELPVLQLVLGFNDHPKTEDELADLLGISSERVMKNIETLKAIGMVTEEINDGVVFWRSQQRSFHISDRYLDEALQFYAQETLQEAQKHLKLKNIQNKFKTIYIPLSDHHYSEFSDELDAFLQKIRHKYSSTVLNDKKIFKLNLNSYPISKKLDAKN